MLASHSDGLIGKLSTLCKVRSGVLGSSLTTFSIGGPVAVLAEPETEAQLSGLLQTLAADSVPFRIIGAGSNILMSDHGVEEVVIRLGRGFREIRELESRSGATVLEVGAAAALMSLSRMVSERGLSGLEFAGGIPASIGGAVFMNAGAHGGEISSVLSEVLVFRDGEHEWIPASAFPFAYRHSGIGTDAVVAAARIALVPGDRERISALRAEHLKTRKRHQPLTLPSAGSIFKNPSPERTAGKVIEECGLKGRVQGGAAVSSMHGNWIVNPDREATAADVRALMQLCVDTVQAKTGLLLHPELKQW